MSALNVAAILSPTSVDQLIEVELRRRGLADVVDDRQLRRALARLGDEARVLERDAQARRSVVEQPHVGFAERVRSVEVLERDAAEQLAAR